MLVHLTAKGGINSSLLPSERKSTANFKTTHPFNHVLSLHQTLGNKAVQRLMTNAERKGASETGKVSSIQRMCTECEEELHRQPMEIAGPTPQISPEAESQINSIRGGGQPLSESIRAFFEPRFGQDFSQVRIHTDSNAQASAKTVNALAYTVGQNVVFGSGQYSPGTRSGKKLIAHELTHVVQQGGLGGALDQASGIGHTDETAEIQAEPASTLVGPKCGVKPFGSLSGPAIRRQPNLSREEEIRLSLTSPGQITDGVNPPMISLYNFAIGQPTLKAEHQNALKTLGLVIKGLGVTKMYIDANGHADSSGEDVTVNVLLSRNRAMAVRKVLQDVSGIAADPSWFGERLPVTTNDTVEGRSRNRRVDIYFKLVNGKKDGKKKKDGNKNGKKNGDGGGGDGDGNGNGGGGDGWSLPSPCDGLLGALICGVVACALAPQVCLFCLKNPQICLGWRWPRPSKKPKKPDEPKIRIACPLSVELPKGRYVPSTDFTIVAQEFQMKLVFKQERPTKSPYCDCNCGEYRQNVSGFFARDYGKGLVKRITHRVAYGLEMLPNAMREDGDPEPYGHRYKDIWAGQLAPNRDKKTDPQGVHDKFIPDRKDGCTYEGADRPGMEGITQDESFHFHLKFEGGPVDACNGDKRLPGWQQWEVEAQRFTS